MSGDPEVTPEECCDANGAKAVTLHAELNISPSLPELPDTPDAVAFPEFSVSPGNAEFDYPTSNDNPLHSSISKRSLDDLTSGEVEGAGAFDRVMSSLRKHIEEEYENNRITGEAYAKAYIDLTTAGLTTAAQYTLDQEQSHQQSLLIQQQARLAESQVAISRIEHATAKANLLRSEYEARQAHAQLRLVELQEVQIQSQIRLSEMQIYQAESDIALSKLNLSLVNAQICGVKASTDAQQYRTANILPEEKRQITYQTDHVLVEQVNRTNYETTQLMPAQRLDVTAGTAIKNYQLNSILPKQGALLEEQVEVQRGQTMDTRSNGSTPIAGAIGKQKELYDRQIVSYDNNDRYKVAKLFVDGWTVQKSLDEGLTPPDQLTNTNIDAVIAGLRSQVLT